MFLTASMENYQTVFGPIPTWSGYWAENFLQKLKGMVVNKARILEQIVKRLNEIEQNSIQEKINRPETILKKKHNSGPMPQMISGIQYREVQFKGMKITTSSPDNVVYLSETEILKVENIVHSTDGKVSLLGKKFVEKRNFFSYPMNSEDLSIFKVNTLSSTLSLHPLASVLFK